VILDEAAASKLEHRGYYKWVQEQKKEEYPAALRRIAQAL
jgi:hypothetical protein